MYFQPGPRAQGHHKEAEPFWLSLAAGDSLLIQECLNAIVLASPSSQGQLWEIQFLYLSPESLSSPSRPLIVLLVA